MKRLRYSIGILGAAALLTAMGCTMKQEAVVNADGSGSVHFHFTVEPAFIDTVREMADLASEETQLPEGDIFNIPQIKKDFSKKNSVSLEKISSPSKDVLDGSFSFKNLESVFKGDEGLTKSGIITVNKQKDRTQVKVHLDKTNYKQVSTLFPLIENPLFSMFGPQEGENITEDEYYQMIELAFGEAGTAGLKRSFIELKIDVKGKILSQTGGKVNGSSVTFRIPLIKVLLLNEPLDYSVTFK